MLNKFSTRRHLNGSLDYEIYVDPSKAFEGKNENYIWKLRKSLYGLKQRGRIWNKTFHTYLIAENFEQSPVDPRLIGCPFHMALCHI